MMILLNNISWMGWNVFLALIPPIFGWLLLITRQKVLKVAFALTWFFFLPNTLYLNYRLASYHLAMASYASCWANSVSFAIYHSCAYWAGYLSPGSVSSGKNAVTFFLAKETIPGSSLDY